MSLVASLRAAGGGFRSLRQSFSCANNRTLVRLTSSNFIREIGLTPKRPRHLHQRLFTPCGVPTRSFADDVDPRAVDFHYFKDALGTPDYFVVDVREPKELVEDGRLFGAINIPLGQVDTEFARSPKHLKAKFHRLSLDEEGANIVFFCKAGIRAEKAVNMAHKHGYTRARFYKGSFLDWVERGGSIIKG